MNEVNIRRTKIKREISNRQKQDYFLYRRKELLCSIQPSIVEQSPEAATLRNLINRSLAHNQLLEDLRHRSLLEMIDHLMRQSSEGRVIELILVLLGNLLLDDITLNEKQDIAKVCLRAYKLDSLSKYQFNNSERNLTCMLSLAHNLSSLCTVLPYIEEQLALACQKVILKQVVSAVSQIAAIIVIREKGDQLLWSCVGQICKRVNEILARLLYSEPQYRGEIKTRFERNSAFFFNLLQSHNRMLPYVMQSPQSKILHECLLSVEQLLSKEITMAEYPVYFESRFFVSICLQQIFYDREQKWTSMALQILTGLLIEYQKINIYSILDLMQIKINQLGCEQFFRTLLRRDTLVESRLALLQIWIASQSQLASFAHFFKGHWKDVVDLCFDVLRAGQSYREQDIALRVLIVASEKTGAISERYNFIVYAQSIGGETLLEQMNSQWIEQKHHGSNEQLQAILQQAYFLLELIRQP